MPDDPNDVIFNEYSLDFFGILKALFGGGAGARSNSIDAGPGGAAEFITTLINFMEALWSVFVVVSWILSIILLFGIIYSYLRAHHYETLQHESVLINERLYAELYGSRNTNNRWEEVMAHIATDSPKDWRLAIIEADIMLEEVLEAAGYAGNTVGEKLKSASTTNFETLDQAWSAHLVRNKIAHAGSDFVLTKRLAQETITQYQMVFNEHGVI